MNTALALASISEWEAHAGLFDMQGQRHATISYPIRMW